MVKFYSSVPCMPLFLPFFFPWHLGLELNTLIFKVNFPPTLAMEQIVLMASLGVQHKVSSKKFPS